jgi:hypothetical protein
MGPSPRGPRGTHDTPIRMVHTRDLERTVMTTPVVTETRRNGNPIRPHQQLKLTD